MKNRTYLIFFSFFVPLFIMLSCRTDDYQCKYDHPLHNKVTFECITKIAEDQNVIWNSESKIGLFSESYNIDNMPIGVAAFSAGSDIGYFYSDILYKDGVNDFSLYFPFDESCENSVVNGTIPSIYTQSGNSSTDLQKNGFYLSNVKCDKFSSKISVELKSLLHIREIKMSSKIYSGWTVENICMKSKSGKILSGNYTYNIKNDEFKLNGKLSDSVLIHISNVTLNDVPISGYILMYEKEFLDDISFSVDLSKEGEASKQLTLDTVFDFNTVLNLDEFKVCETEDTSINLSDPNNTGSVETANCYIAGEASTKYKFPANIKGNGVSISTYKSTELNGKSVGVLWQTSKNLIFDVKLLNEYIYFSTNINNEGKLMSGNAVIALYSDENCQGQILWSWHIWVTDADIDGNIQKWKVNKDLEKYTNYVNPYLMDRNLGALTIDDYSISNTNGSRGLSYQWGRKDPFVTVGDLSFTTNEAAITYDALNNKLEPIHSSMLHSNKAEWTFVEKQLNLDDASAYPMSFVSGKANNMWVQNLPHDLWGAGNLSESSNNIGKKTMFDPCPPGYRVMNAYAMTGVTAVKTGGKLNNMKHNILNLSTYRKEHNLEILCSDGEVATLPAGGMIAFDKGASGFPLWRHGGYGYYWTALNKDVKGNKAVRVQFDWNNFRPIDAGHSSYGQLVRCERIK